LDELLTLRTMRILILTWKDPHHPDAGGAEVVTFEFARRLQALGHEVTWFSRRFAGCESEETIEGIPVFRQGRLLTTYLYAPLFYRRMRPRPDLVLDMINTICWQAPLFAGRRTVAFVHQLAREVFFHHLPRPLSWAAYAVEGLQYVPYRRTPFLCVSAGTKSDLVGIRIPAENVTVIPLGLDHVRHRPGAAKSPSPSFVFVGRLVAMKRAGLCVQAMRRVVDRHSDARLAILGSGPESERIEALIRELRLEHAVTLVTRDSVFGDESRDVKVELMQRAWALVLPSVKEGWGMVVTEAAACGTPSIVTNVTGLRESVQPGVTGLVVSANPTASELAEAMIRLIEDDATRRALSSAAIDWAARFNWDRSFECFYDGLTAAVARRGGVPDEPPSRDRNS
jgi:glycosyltransferase involved in cell wall biosynthesis